MSLLQNKQVWTVSFPGSYKIWCLPLIMYSNAIIYSNADARYILAVAFLYCDPNKTILPLHYILIENAIVFRRGSGGPVYRF